MRNFIVLLMLVLMSGGCVNNNQNHSKKISGVNWQKSKQTDFVLQIKYAKGYTIQQYEDYKLIQLLNPWKEGEVSYQYIIPTNELDEEFVMPANCVVFTKPIKKIAILSLTHVEPLSMLKQLDLIGLVADGGIINNEYLRKRIVEKKVIDLHKSGMARPDAESVLEFEPDLVFTTSFESLSPEDKKMLQAELPLCFVCEWMEASPLARAEWIKFFAAFLGLDQEADRLFNEIEQNYQNACQLVKDCKYKPSVMFNSDFKGMWYTPGGDSYVAKLAKDAGAFYYWEKEKKTGSLPLSFEIILDKQQNADFWLNPGMAKSLKELGNKDERYTLFQALRNKSVFSNNKRVGAGGGNDWWESGVMHPDIILKDMIHIFHPEIIPEYEMYYFQKLN